MSDLISRQAAIDDVCKMMYECFGADDEELDAIEVTLRELPAVQPDHTADVSKKVERTDETAQNVQDEDLISKLSEIRSEYNCFDEDGEPQYRALSKAIRILSQLADGDTISRQMTIDAVSEYATIWMSYTDDMSASDIAQEAINSAKDTMIRILKEQPTVQPETATVTIGRTKGDVTMWYECDACGEPIDQKDCYCRNCGRKLTLPKPYRGGEK